MITSDKHLINYLDVSDLNFTVKHPNGTKAQIMKIGNLKLTDDIILNDVMVIPDYCVNLISVNKMAKDNKLYTLFTESHCYIQDLLNQKQVMIGKEVSGLYTIRPNFISQHNNANGCWFSGSSSHLLWHCRLGHPSDNVLHVLKKDLSLSKHINTQPCDICHKAKQSKNSFSNSNHKSTNIGDLVHLDVWGPFRITSREGFKFFLTIVDDFSRAVWVYMIKSKDHVVDCIESFFALVLNQFNITIKICRSDNGSEFVNQRIQTLFSKNGVIHQTPCVYTPQQNGVVERKHRHLLNSARSLMFQGVFLCLCGLNLS
jgi:hypothetical protein